RCRVSSSRQKPTASRPKPMASMQGLTLLFALLLVILLAFLFALLGSCAQSVPASAQTGQPPAADLAAYAGADRMEKLLAAAKKEGSVTVYSSAATDDMAALIAAFEKTYGVKVRLWRASSENIVQRAVVEARGGRFEADVVETGAIAMESMQRERLFREIKTPALYALLPAAILPHREWIGTRFNIFVAAYNTGLIKKGELPKRYDDLLDRRWAGKLGVEAEDSDWFGGGGSALGAEKGHKLFRAFAAAYRKSGRQGPAVLARPVGAVCGSARALRRGVQDRAAAQERRADRLVRHSARRGTLRGRRRRPPRLASECRNPVFRVHAHRWAGHPACSRFLSGSGKRKAAT